MANNDDDGSVEYENGEELEVDDDDEEDDEESEDPLANLPDYVKVRVEKLKELDDKRNEIMDEYLKERAILEQKYNNLYEPLYNERNLIINGEKDNEIDNIAPESNNIEEEERVKGIPNFWTNAMTNMDTIGELLTEEDIDCLEHLTDIKCEDQEDGKGFILTFYFNENEYFRNQTLTKTYSVPNLLLSDEPILKKVDGCTINWKSNNKCLTHKTVQKKQRGKGKHTGQVRTITKTEEKESFFHWFTPPKMPKLDEMDENEAEQLEEAFDDDYEIAAAFRKHIIPKAVLWFTGEADEEEMQHAVEEALAENNIDNENGG